MEQTVELVGLKIKAIADRKGFSVKDLAGAIGKERGFVYDTFKRKSMSYGEMKRWAEILEVAISEISGQEFEEPKRDSNYLTRYIEELENRVREQAKMIEVLLGKSNGVPFLAGLRPLFFSGSGANSGTPTHG